MQQVEIAEKIEKMENTAIYLEKYRANPKLYLFDYHRVGLASIHASFIQSVYEGYCFTIPESITCFSYGDEHFIRASDCSLSLDQMDIKIPPDDADHFSLINWLFAKSLNIPTPNPLLPFESIALIIYLTEWCVANIAVNRMQVRQTFYQGIAITPCECRDISGSSDRQPIIQLQFTVAPPQFNSNLLNPEDVIQVFNKLQARNYIPKELQLNVGHLDAKSYLIQ